MRLNKPVLCAEICALLRGFGSSFGIAPHFSPQIVKLWVDLPDVSLVVMRRSIVGRAFQGRLNAKLTASALYANCAYHLFEEELYYPRYETVQKKHCLMCLWMHRLSACNIISKDGKLWAQK
jgi:hypothetical protein